MTFQDNECAHAYYYVMKTLCRYDAETRQVHRFQHPNVFEQRSNGGHGVDDNNNLRSKAGDLARSWKSHSHEKKHLMAVFATAEANAICYWNYKHPNNHMTKLQWREAIVAELLQAMSHQDRATANRAQVRPARGISRNESRSIHSSHKLMKHGFRPNHEYLRVSMVFFFLQTFSSCN